MEKITFLRELRKWFETEKNNLVGGNFVLSFFTKLPIPLFFFSRFLPHYFALSKKGSENFTFIFNILNAILFILLLLIAVIVFIESISEVKNSVLSFVFGFMQKWADNIFVTLFMLILPAETILYRLLLGYGLFNLLKDAIQNNTNPFFVASFVLFALKLIVSVFSFIEKKIHHLLLLRLNPSQYREFIFYTRKAGIPTCPLRFEILLKKQKATRSANCQKIISRLESRIKRIKEKQERANYLKNSNITSSESVAAAIIEQEK